MEQGTNTVIGQSQKALPGNIKFQLFAVVSASYLCISAGNVLGYTSTAISSMQESDHFRNISRNEISWIGSLASLGALVGSLITVFFIKYFGTRKTILFFALPLFLLSWLALGAFETLEMIFFGRFLGGLASGITISTSPVYITDVVSLNRRGSLGSLPHLFLTIGILMVYTIGAFVNWAYLAISCGFITFPAFILLILIPDTPTWLIKMGEIAKGMQVLEKLYGKEMAQLKFSEITSSIQEDEREVPNTNQENESLQVEIGSIENDIDSSINTPVDESSWFFKIKKLLSNIIVDRAFFLALCIICLPQFVGINFVASYGVEIFKDFVPDPNVPCIIFASTQVIATLITISIIERFGRKFLLIISALVVSVASAVLGINFYISSVYKTFFISVPIVALSVYILFFCLGLGAITWIIVVEILRKETKHIQNPILVGCMWFCSFLVTRFFPNLEIEIGEHGIFGIFAVVALLGALFIFMCVPETKGKSNEEIRLRLTKANLNVST